MFLMALFRHENLQREGEKNSLRNAYVFYLRSLNSFTGVLTRDWTEIVTLGLQTGMQNV